MLSVSNEGTPNLPTTIMSYSYDNVGNVRSMTDTINGNLGIETTREYDALNRLTVNAQGNKRVDYTYNAISQVTNKKRYSDITGTNLVAETNHIYDSINRLTNIIHGNGANTISSYAQTYDAASKITSVTGTDGSSTYTYDDTNQLTGADYDFQADESYSYDGNGNRTNDGYVTGVNNQLLEDNKYLYEYDLVGNRTKRTDKSTNEVMEYRWDIRDRLTGITVKNDLGEIIRTAEYTYDVYNQRIAKTVDTDGDGSLAAVTERFVYGPDQNIALVFDENGNVNHRYLFGDGVDQIEADESNGSVLWALTDHLGSVRDVVDDSGTVLNHVVYDAFGGVTSQTDESVVFRYGYTARELDAESGLQYNRARYLDSFTGKFISEDPISFQGGDSNLYRYVYNSSTNFIDPSGNIPIAFLAPVAVKALTTIVGGVSFLLSLQPSQNQQNSVSPFIDKPEPPDPRPFTFPNPTPTRLPEIETYPNHISDPNAINRGKDFGDIGKICQNLGFPLNSPSSPNDINKGRNFDLLLPHIFLSKDVQLGGGYKVPEDIYHPSGADGLKQEIIQGVKDAGYKVSKVGRNPDIKIEDGKIVLYSQQNSKVTIKTDIPVSKYPEIIKSK
jgi:RHS repeat-associated protein